MVSIQSLHTFHLPVHAERVVTVSSLKELITAYTQAQASKIPVLMLGEGSNVIFIEDFSGWVVINRIMGIKIQEETHYWRLHVGAGENWHQLVCFTLHHGMDGLENLALIPGCCGSAPIQNIGAYGAEFKQVCDYVDVINITTAQTERLNNEQCQFAYRDSIFKHQDRQDHIITHIGLKLPKLWHPILNYGELKIFDQQSVTALQIFDQVCATRRKKLPDPQVTGNAGSFFKNPLITTQQAKKLIQYYPGMPHYQQPDGTYKLAAGWLIDQCGLKNYQIGGAAVHTQQALVLVNKNNATCRDLIDLARHVRQQVLQQFNVNLEPEVRFIGAEGEVNGINALT